MVSWYRLSRWQGQSWLAGYGATWLQRLFWCWLCGGYGGLLGSLQYGCNNKENKMLKYLQISEKC